MIFMSNVGIPASVKIEHKLIMDLNSNCRDCSTQKNRAKNLWFSADYREMVER